MYLRKNLKQFIGCNFELLMKLVAELISKDEEALGCLEVIVK